jgi:UDP-3-O-[3-hydroxymyristoyl] glucosamine N-acyltransferase
VSFSVSELSRHVQGTVHGDAQFRVEHLKSLEQATGQDISYVNGIKYLPQALSSKAGVLIAPAELVEQLRTQCQVIEVASPYLAFAILSHVFAAAPQLRGIAATAQIHPSAVLGHNVVIGDYAVIGADVEIGDNALIFPFVHIAEQVKIGHSAYVESHVSILAATCIGDQVRIHANTCIGGEGFGFAPYQHQWHRIAQLGRVRIGNQVRIGSNCSIDRGALDDTIIEDGVIIDNLVQIAHNVQIGKHSAIAAKTGIAGSSKIGQHCIIAGACGISGHLEIADHVHLTGMSMVTKSISQAGIYSSGTGLFDNLTWRKTVVGLRQLTETPINKLVKQLQALHHRIEKLELVHHTDKKDEI